MTELHITTVGFDNWESTFIKTTINLAYGMDIGQWRYSSNPHEVDAILINIDTSGGQAVLDQYTSQDRDLKPHVVICSENEEEKYPGFQFLKRPILYGPLVSLLRKLQMERPRPDSTEDRAESEKSVEESESVNAEKYAVTMEPLESNEHYADQITVASENPADENLEGIPSLHDIVEKNEPDDQQLEDSGHPLASDGDAVGDEKPEPRVLNEITMDTEQRDVEGSADKDMLAKERPARRFYDATRYLGLVKKIIARGRAEEITHVRFSPVRIYPQQKIYATPLGTTLNPEMFRTLASEFVIHRLRKTEENDLPPRWQSMPIRKLLYMAALYGSEGRLLENSNINDKLRLTIVPDFDLLPHTEEHKIIAEYMVDHLEDLHTIATETKLNIETVVDFCNACGVLLLIWRSPANFSLAESTERDENQHAVTTISTADAEKIKSSNTKSTSLIKRIALFLSGTR